MTSTDEEGKRKEAELRQYLANHRRRSEAFGSGPKNPKADEAGGEPSEAATGVGAAAGSSSDTKAAGGAEGAGGFDMFSETFTEKEIDGPNMEEVDEAALMDRGDNYDDKEGYYAHRVGDILNDRYKVRRARMRRLLLRVLLPCLAQRLTQPALVSLVPSVLVRRCSVRTARASFRRWCAAST